MDAGSMAAVDSLDAGEAVRLRIAVCDDVVLDEVVSSWEALHDWIPEEILQWQSEEDWSK